MKRLDFETMSLALVAVVMFVVYVVFAAVEINIVADDGDKTTAIETTEQTASVGEGAGREETAHISTEASEAVEDTTERVEPETDAETDAETSADAGIWETEPETAAVMYYEPETEAVDEVIPAPETDAALEAPAEVDEFSDYCPMPLDHHAVLCEVCEASGVPYGIAMALIYTESRFDPYAVSAAGCYGYCQLHPAYFPVGLSPEDNIRVGIGWLGELIAEHGDIGTALTVYAVGHDNGSRWYAGVIFARAQEWGYVG